MPSLGSFQADNLAAYGQADQPADKLGVIDILKCRDLFACLFQAGKHRAHGVGIQGMS